MCRDDIVVGLVCQRVLYLPFSLSFFGFQGNKSLKAEPQAAAAVLAIIVLSSLEHSSYSLAATSPSPPLPCPLLFYL